METEFNKLIMEDKDCEELFIMGENFSENVLKLNDLLIYLCNNVMLIDKEKSIKLMNFTKDKLIKSIQNVYDIINKCSILNDNIDYEKFVGECFIDSSKIK